MSQNALKDMIWGVAISAAQTESAADYAGKGPSIWDDFCAQKPHWFTRKTKIKKGEHLADSCDFYNHYQSDIDHLKKIGFKHFRFSISWSRVMPDGVQVNPEGLAFYQDVVKYCLSQDICPWITLYHWDLPLALEQKGGWCNRAILEYFKNYAEVCVKALPEVKHWMVLNEPSVFLGAGYLFGIHAPGKKDFNAFFSATHHALLSIGVVYRHMKQLNPDLQVGSTFSFTHIESEDQSKRSVKAAEIADQLINRFFFEPIVGKGYPIEHLSKLKQIKKFFKPGDEESLKVELDFIGLQTYTREVFKHNHFNPFLKIKLVPAKARSLDLTAMDWEIHPESLYHCIMKIHAYGIDTPLYVTENGAAFDDKLMFNRVHDTARIHYFQTHINEAIRAKQEGANLKGYFAWSLLDNFEWAEGYSPRFGLLYVDFISKARILKDSAYWFRSFLGGTKQGLGDSV